MRFIMHIKNVSKFTVFLSLLLLHSCMGAIKPKEPTVNATSVNVSNYSGCVTATGLSTSTIQVQYSFPSNATEVMVYRDGVNVMSSKNRLNTTFTDINLQEGGTYHYTCEAIINGVVSAGTREVDGTTLSVNAPVFSGISSVTILSPTSVKITWPATNGGSSVKSFKVYAKMNDTVDFTVTPRATINSGTTYTTNLTGLADDMPYKFAVRACNASDVCDTNTKEIATTMSDNGAATTVGASGVSLYNGAAIITVPWTEAYGAVKKRRLYRSTTNNATTILSNLIKTVDVTVAANLNNPPTTIEDNTIVQGTTYYYIARDEDPSGNINTNQNIVSITTGDLTAPIFSGLTAVALDNPQETSALLSFTAISSQPTDPAGASYYLLYQTESTPPTDPANSCTSNTATLTATLDANLFIPGNNSTYRVSNLSSRKKYSFCLKAQDEALNISNTLSYREQVMPDLTAPQFDGLQNVSYNLTTEKFTLVWNPSSSSDIYQFKVKVWKNTATPTVGQITTLTYNASTNPSSALFGKTDFSFSDGDTVYMLVDACDNASPTFNTSDNCTANALSSAISKNLIDTTPPAGFLGIQSATATSQGVVKVDWSLPTDKTDYAGFKFYNIEEVTPGNYQKVFLGDTYCTSNNCATNPKTTFNLSVSRDYHKYNLFMSAVDNYGNETNATTALSSLTYFQLTTIDTTKPNFTSALNIVTDSGNFNLSWNTATDNQYAKLDVSTTNLIKYDIYRKAGTTLLDPANYIDGLPDIAGDVTISRIANNIAVTNFSDPTAALDQGQTYSYTICSKDMSGNYKCEGVRSVVLADNLAPVIDMAYANPSTPNSSTWDLKLKVKDGAKDATSVITYAYVKFSDNNTDFPSGTGALAAPAVAGVGASGAEQVYTYYNESLSNSNNKHYANYLIKAVDAAGNISLRQESIVIRKPTLSATTLGATITEDTFTTINSLTPGAPAPGLSASNFVYTVVTNASHGSVTNCRAVSSTVSCDYTPAANYFGTDSFTYRVNDGYENSTTVVTVNLTITNVNDNPVAVDTTVSMMGGDSTYLPAPTSLNIGMSSLLSDPDNTIAPGTDLLSVNYVASSVTTNGGSVTCSGTSCTFTMNGWEPPTPFNRFGTVTFQYTVSDDKGGTSAPATVTVKVYTPYTWTGATGNGSFTDKNNWCGSLNGSGNCIGATAAPISTSNLVFSNLCTNCNVTIPTGLTFNNLQMSRNYTGTVTLGSGSSLTLNELILDGGTFDATGASSITVVSSKNFIDEGAKFKSPVQLTFSIGGCNDNGGSPGGILSKSASGGLFEHNNGTLTLSSSCTDTASTRNGGWNFSPEVHLYNLKTTTGQGTELNLFPRYSGSGCSNYILNIDNNFTHERGKLRVTSFPGGCPIYVGGNLIVNYANSSNYGDASTLKTIFTGATSTITMGDSTKSAGYVTVDGSGTLSSSTANLNVAGLTVKNGTFNAPTGTLTVTGDFKYDNSGSATPLFNHNGGTVKFNITTGGAVTNFVPGDFVFNHLEFTGGNYATVNMNTGTVNVDGDLTLSGNGPSTSFANGIGNGTLKVKGNVTASNYGLQGYGSTSFTRDTATIELIGTNNHLVTGVSTAYFPVIKVNSSGVTTFNGTIRVSTFQNLTNNIDMISNNATLVINEHKSGTFNLIPGTSNYYNVKFSNGQYPTYNLNAGTFNILNNLEIYSSTGTTWSAYISNGIFNLYGNLTVTGYGAHGSADIKFINSSQAQYMSQVSGSTLPTGTFTVNNPNGLYLLSNMYINSGAQLVDVISGGIEMGGYTLEVGSLQLNGNTVNKSSGILKVNGTTIGTGSLYGGTVNP